jgi:hypothetical protein
VSLHREGDASIAHSTLSGRLGHWICRRRITGDVSFSRPDDRAPPNIELQSAINLEPAIRSACWSTPESGDSACVAQNTT